MRSRRTILGTTIAGLALTGLATAGCSASAPGRASKSESAGSSTALRGTALSGAAQAAAPKATAGAGSTANRVTLRPSRILTADLTVEVRPASVDSTADRATSLVLGAGGDLAGDQRQRSGRDRQADLTLKVPPARYVTVLDQLARLGTETSRSAQQTDVTDEVVDVDARVAAQQASVNRIAKLLSGATKLGDVVLIEGELARRQGDLESLQARQRALDGQTSMATVTLHLRGSALKAPAPKPQTGFAGGLRNGWHAFTTALALVLTALGALLPFAVLAGLLAGVVLAVRRRRQPAAVVPPAAAG